jgi:hypothetical protein
MKAAQEAAKAAKAPVKERKIIFFQSYLKASVVKLVLFFINLSAYFQDYFSYFLEAQTLPTGCPAIHFNLFVCQKGCQRIFILSGYFTTFFP